MATIEKRGKFQWRAKVRRKGYPPQNATFDTKGAAEVWARHIEREMDTGIFVSRLEGQRTTLAEALDRYERDVTPAKKGWKQEGYRIGYWRKHLGLLITPSVAAIQGFRSGSGDGYGMPHLAFDRKFPVRLKNFPVMLYREFGKKS